MTKILDPSRLESLLESTQLLHSSLDLSDLLRHLLRSVMGRLLVSRGLIAVAGDGNVKIAIVKGATGIAVGEVFSLERIRDAGINLVFPIGEEENPIGYLAIGQPPSEELLREEQEFVRALLGIAASVIDNARAHSQTKRLNQELEQKVHELRTILDFVKGLSTTLEPSEIAQLLVFTLVGRWAVKKHAIAIWKDGQDPLLRQKGIELPPINELSLFLVDMPEAIKVVELTDSPIKDIFLTQQIEVLFPILIASATNITNNTTINNLSSAREISNVAGVVALGSRTGALSYEDSDLDFGVGVVAQAAIAFQNAWYFKEAVERQRAEAQFQAEQRANFVFSAFTDVLTGVVLDGKYRLEVKIGSGGFGVVYCATHIDLNRLVAIKILRPIIGNNAKERLERFRQEGISACRINHPNAVSVIDFVISPTGIAYLVMELLNGHTLAGELKEKRRVPLKRCLEILVPVCDVLEQIHSLGMVHRDIKPDNIFLHQTPQGEIIKVVDFGLTKIFANDENNNSPNLTGAGDVLGTPAYMAPERFGSMNYDGKADVYSLGLVIYEMLAGELPFIFSERTPYKMAMVHIQEKPKTLRQLNPFVPEAIEAVVMQTLRKNPDKRPTMKEFSENFVRAFNSLADEEIENSEKMLLVPSSIQVQLQDFVDSKTETVSIKVTKLDSEA
jgi:serine/threonine protein kinase